MNILKKFFYQLEPLEFDLQKQFHERNYGNLQKLKILFFKNIKYIYKIYQRLILSPGLRKYFAKFEKLFFFDLKKKEKESFFSDKIKNDGFAEINGVFSEEELDYTIKDLSQNQYLSSIYTNHSDFKLDNVPDNVHTGYIHTEKLVKSKYILKAANNPELLKILDNYFKCKYQLDWIWSWWSFPTKDPIGPQNFHRDYESMNFVKVFTYLTDVDNNSGPHEFIEGSHKLNAFYKRERFSDENIINHFGKQKIKKIKGKKGKSFIANTFGIHKGYHPINYRRLVLVFLYTVVPSNRSPKVPILSKDDVNFEIKNKYLNRLFID